MSYRLKPGVILAGANGSFGPGVTLPDDFNPTALEQLQKAGQVEEVPADPAPAEAPAPETPTPPAGQTAAAPTAPKPAAKVVTVAKPATK